MNNLCSFVIDNIKTAFESLPQKGTNEQFLLLMVGTHI